RRGEREHGDGGELDHEHPGAVDGYGQQVAQRTEVGLTGDRVGRDRGERHGEEQRDLQGQRGERGEDAVLRDLVEEVGAATAPGGRRHLDGDDDEYGYGGEYRHADPVTSTPEDKQQLGPEEPGREPLWRDDLT